ncbi:MAG: glycosyltransferase [Gammaproteobacteria bacterium HGW-Gammaproteobacteria-3]|nr:MAG: glycosyltransferase [Gammaproteobacteria bacterium HGW-Gammaproteobacteria-3]
MVNVICIKWGSLYGPEFVNKLYAMVKRNLSLEFRFVCMTDNAGGIDDAIETLPIPEIGMPEGKPESGWKKLTVLSPEISDLSGKTLFLDLDVVIVDAIDELFAYADSFTIIENWTQKGRGIGNSSVFCYDIGRHADVLDYYKAHKDEVLAQYGNEQIYLSKKVGAIKYWPQQWCRSFKFHAIPRGILRYFLPPTIPSCCKILVFHGHPNPDQALVGNYGGRLLKYFKPAAWIEKYWV